MELASQPLDLNGPSMGLPGQLLTRRPIDGARKSTTRLERPLDGVRKSTVDLNGPSMGLASQRCFLAHDTALQHAEMLRLLGDWARLPTETPLRFLDRECRSGGRRLRPGGYRWLFAWSCASRRGRVEANASAKAAALGGVGPRHARRPEAADRWPSGFPAWSLVTERALAAPMKHPVVASRSRVGRGSALAGGRGRTGRTPPRQPSPGLPCGETLLEGCTGALLAHSEAIPGALADR
jgi:hypothetical protein